jgi:hypothetical protein
MSRTDGNIAPFNNIHLFKINVKGLYGDKFKKRQKRKRGDNAKS